VKALEALLRLLNDNPWLWVVAIAWIAGVVGNITRGKQQKERAEARREARRIGRPGTEGAGGDDEEREPREQQRPMPQAARTEAEIAREMRRILGVEEAPAPPSPAPPVPPPLVVRPRRAVIAPERAPTPVMPTAGARHLPIHVESHVGDAMGRRAPVGSGRVGEHAAGEELGNLGGRTPVRGRARSLRNRYAIDDLKRILVLNEILGPPLALRGERRD
jgi:hypothetical protein